jgi:hypothetical protein
MATIFRGAALVQAPRRVDRYNADMRAWMRLLMWATRNCGR